MGLAYDPEGAAVRQAPELVRRGIEPDIALQLGGLPPRIVGRFRQAPALPKAVENLAMGGAIGKPGRLETEHLCKGGVVKVQATGGGEDRYRVGDMVQGLVMGLHIPAQRLPELFSLGHVLGPDPDSASLQRPCAHPEGAPAPAQADPSDGFPRLGLGCSLHRQDIRGRVQAETPLRRIEDVGGSHRR